MCFNLSKSLKVVLEILKRLFAVLREFSVYVAPPNKPHRFHFLLQPVKLPRVWWETMRHLQPHLLRLLLQPLCSFPAEAARTDAELRAAALIYNEARVKLRGNEMEIRVR